MHIVGIGTIGLVAAKRAKNVIGVELNPDASMMPESMPEKIRLPMHILPG